MRFLFGFRCRQPEQALARELARLERQAMLDRNLADLRLGEQVPVASDGVAAHQAEQHGEDFHCPSLIGGITKFRRVNSTRSLASMLATSVTKASAKPSLSAMSRKASAAARDV